MAQAAEFTECCKALTDMVNLMKKEFVRILLLLMGFCAFQVYADDTDIYLYTDEASSNPPFSLVMFDYRPSTGSKVSNSLAACRDDMTEDGFVYLCAARAVNPKITDPDGTPRPDLDRQLCRNWYRDTLNGGAEDGLY